MTLILDIELFLNGMVKGITCTIPKIKIYQDKIPAGTKKLSIILEDIDLLNLPHGMHLIEFEGSDIVLENTFKIIPLAPPPGKSHQYQLTVRAFDDNHSVIGVGTAIQQYP